MKDKFDGVVLLSCVVFFLILISDEVCVVL